MTVKVGDIVLYISERNDGVISPAIVLRTADTTNADLLRQWPTQEEIDAEIEANGVSEATLSGKGRPEGLVVDLGTSQVDLLVHGLGGDYRRYGVHHSRIHHVRHIDGAGGTWTEKDKLWA